ncbi:MAG: nitrile hydratase subunit beta [Gammaproteobacteria bacterium]
MNGIHDMGGITSFGPVIREENEPVFHDDWERRVFAVMFLSGLGPIDASRHAIERMDPQHYLETTYYEHWLSGIERLAEEQDLAGRPASDEPITADMIADIVAAGSPSTRESDRQPRFVVGDTVRAKNLSPTGHTRLPRYVRGRVGTVVMLHGNHVFPDTAAHHRGENPQPLYAVRFTADALWDENTTRRDSVTIDLWEDYLEAMPA